MTTAVQLAQSVAPGVSLGFKNRIINGGMRIDQRNAGASVTQTTAYPYLVDRWSIGGGVTSKFSAQQVVDAPAGFYNSVKVTSLSAYTPLTSEQYSFRQPIEANNMLDVGWGTINAKAVTLSFWAKSSLTGTFGGSLYNYAGNYSYPFSYSIASANTWTQITVSITGPTSGSWNAGNTGFVWVDFSMGAGPTVLGTAGSWASTYYAGVTGQTNIVATNAATFYITGVQLEVGTAATPFEFRDYGRELIMCQRYYDTSYDTGVAPGSSSALGSIQIQGATGTLLCYAKFSQKMRAAPTVVSYAPDNGTSGNVWASGFATASNVQQIGLSGMINGMASGSSTWMRFHYTASAEL